MTKQDKKLEEFQKSYQAYQIKVAQLKREGNSLIKELEEALSKVKARAVLNKVGQKYTDKN